MSPWLHEVQGFGGLPAVVHVTLVGLTVQSPNSPLLTLSGAGWGRVLAQTMRSLEPPDGRKEALAVPTCQTAAPARRVTIPQVTKIRSSRITPPRRARVLIG